MENKYEAKEAWAVSKYSLKVTKALLISMNDKPIFFREPSTMLPYEPNEVVIFDIHIVNAIVFGSLLVTI